MTAAADNKGFVVTTKRSKLSHKPAKATLAVTMKAGLGRSLHKVRITLTCGLDLWPRFTLITLQTKASLNKQRYRKDLTKAAMRRAAAIVRLVDILLKEKCSCRLKQRLEIMLYRSQKPLPKRKGSKIAAAKKD